MTEQPWTNNWHWQRQGYKDSKALLPLTWMTLQGEYKKECLRMIKSMFRIGDTRYGSQGKK